MNFHRGGSQVLALGPKEREVLVLAAALTEHLGHPPTVPEIVARLPGTPRTAVYGRVGELRRKRFVALERRRGQRAGVLVLTAAGRQVASEGKSGLLCGATA